MVLLDTHIWLWWLLGDGALKASQRKALDDLARNAAIAISWTSIWETEILERKGRISLLPDFQTWMAAATSSTFCTIIPVDYKLVMAQRILPETFHADPADRLIVTSAITSGIPLATHDSKILSSGATGLDIWDWK
jgi:PIN domain nuclease of toxin-antitoxin system